VDIRPAASTDIPQLLSLIRRYWDFEGIKGFAALRIELMLKELLGASAPGAVWVAELHGRLQGYLIAVLVLSIEHQGLMGEIDEFFVLPEARSGGTGARLLVAVEKALRERGCVRLQLQLGAANARARTFYRRHGYAARSGYDLWDKSL
jgi:GNAT superfamily N-acetyltransferase